jgi:hypothetical protein
MQNGRRMHRIANDFAGERLNQHLPLSPMFQRLISSLCAKATSLIGRVPGFNCPEVICSRIASATRLTRSLSE